MHARVHYIGSYDPDYARHRILQKGLRELGVSVTETVDRSFLPLRWVRLARKISQIPDDVLIVVGESGNYLTPDLWWARLIGRPVVFDTFVSLQDTFADRCHGPMRYFMSALGGAIDRMNARAALVVLVDTEQTGAYFAAELGVPRANLSTVYVGAETDRFFPTPIPDRPAGTMRALFYGSFIPLHGIEVIVAAARTIQESHPGIAITLVGDGQEYRSIRRLVRSLRLTNISFGPRYVPYDVLPRLISGADLCLGVFADRPKTRRVIPHKVFQSAAAGRPVLTADTLAVREVFDEESIVLVPPGDPIALAGALLEMAANPRKRATLASAAADVVHNGFAPVNVATQLIASVA